MKLRRKLLLFGFAVAGLAALGVFLAGGAVIRRSVSDRVRERLLSEAHLLAHVAARDPGILPEPAAVGSSRSEEFARAAGRALGMRVTLVAVDGRVVGDSALSEEEVLRVENHGSRPEIVAARAAGVGSSERHSTTVGEDLFYIARRVDRGGLAAGFVRLAVPVTEIRRTTGHYSLVLALASFAALLIVSLVGYIAARRFSRPIEEMSRAADAIASGRRDLRVDYPSGDELGRLGAALNRMTRALSEQIEALSGEKRLLDSILAGMSEGILVVDPDRRVLLCNEASRALFGLRGADPTGRPLIEVVRDGAILEGFQQVLERGGWFREIIPTGGGGGRTFEVTVSPLTGPSGRQAGAIGVFLDVSKLTALENVRREFVADVSHELRTPLTSIKAFVETLLAGDLEDAADHRRFLGIVRKHSDRMEAILDDLTDLSLIETGAVGLDKERLDLGLLVQELVDSLRPRAGEAGVTIRVEIQPGTWLVADRRRLEQVLLNLMGNAIKFTKPGGSVTIRTDVPEAGTLRVEVEDTGIGIPASALDKVFHRFYRVDRARSREMGGTGLGLSIVKHLMRLHGGSVRVESELGRGSRFLLDFPREGSP